jgi:DNA-binding LytR/AlgR family response regulator
MKRPTAIIAEDEPLLRGELRETLAALWPELEIVAECEDGIATLHALDIHAPDILFLDIQMPGMTGIEVAGAASGRCHVVFVTAYNQHAVAAFDQGAVDYVMKPFSAARLATAVSRLKERIDSKPANLDGLLKALATGKPARSFLRWINVSQGQNVRVVTVEEICYFKSDTKYTLLVTQDAESLIKKPIRELTDELDPEIFWQIHRSTVVNVNAIAAVHRTISGHYEVRLKQRPETLAVSGPYAHLFRQM